MCLFQWFWCLLMNNRLFVSIVPLCRSRRPSDCEGKKSLVLVSRCSTVHTFKEIHTSSCAYRCCIPLLHLQLSTMPGLSGENVCMLMLFRLAMMISKKVSYLFTQPASKAVTSVSGWHSFLQIFQLCFNGNLDNVSTFLHIYLIK